ncbi:MAG: ACT domain-containing protein [Oscillospiraceae bacterium]
MKDNSGELILVDSNVLPDIILKVLKAKQMRATGEAATSAEACRAVGISRSAYYKYKDSVFNYEERFSDNMLSVYCVLRDEKGVLSSIISKLYEFNANILTINQNIPIDSVATVSISLRFDYKTHSMSELKNALMNLYGVVEVRIISGE